MCVWNEHNYLFYCKLYGPVHRNLMQVQYYLNYTSRYYISAYYFWKAVGKSGRVILKSRKTLFPISLFPYFPRCVYSRERNKQSVHIKVLDVGHISLTYSDFSYVPRIFSTECTVKNITWECYFVRGGGIFTTITYSYKYRPNKITADTAWTSQQDSPEINLSTLHFSSQDMSEIHVILIKRACPRFFRHFLVWLEVSCYGANW